MAASVVRAGDTVRKPAGYWTPAVEALLAFLEARGFSGAPRALGRDDRGRQVLEYVPENGARTGVQPWARLHAEGHGAYWAACADYIDRHLATWRQFLR